MFHNLQMTLRSGSAIVGANETEAKYWSNNNSKRPSTHYKLVQLWRIKLNPNKNDFFYFCRISLAFTPELTLFQTPIPLSKDPFKFLGIYIAEKRYGRFSHCRNKRLEANKRISSYQTLRYRLGCQPISLTLTSIKCSFVQSWKQATLPQLGPKPTQ